MPEPAETEVTVVGAGLGGSLMCVYLGAAGYRVALYERRPDPRRDGRRSGHSINLALSTRGIRALEQVGAAARVLEMSVPMRGRMVHGRTGKVVFQPYGVRANQVLHSIRRYDLNCALLDLLDQHLNVTAHFASVCTGLDLDRGQLHVTDQVTGASKPVAVGPLIAADGARSTVRQELQYRTRFDYRQEYLRHGYVELSIPQLPGGNHVFDREALHIWPRGELMLVALPNVEGDFTATLFLPHEGPHSFATITDENALLMLFERQFPDVVSAMPHCVEEFRFRPPGNLVTICCDPWHVAGQVVLLGDAAHAVVPFYGQGANAAFEDCRILSACLESAAGSFPSAFAEYTSRRKPDCDALAELSIANFQEMCSQVDNALFKIRKWESLLLYRLFPQWFIPLYTMVSFTQIPYAQAVRRAARKRRSLRLAGLGLLAVLAFLILATELSGSIR